MMNFFITTEKNSPLLILLHLSSLGYYTLILFLFPYFNNSANNAALLIVYSINLIALFVMLPIFSFTYYIDAYSKKSSDESICSNNIWFYNLDPATLSLYNLCFAAYKLFPFLIITLLFNAYWVNFALFILVHTPILLIAFTIPLAPHTYFGGVDGITLRWRIIHTSGWLFVVAGLIIALVNTHSRNVFGLYFMMIGLVFIAASGIRLYTLVGKGNYEIHN